MKTRWVGDSVGNSLISFLSKWLVCLRKTEQMRDLLKKTSASLIFGGRPERFAHSHTFLMSNLSESLRLLIFGERPEQFAVTVALLS